MILSGNPGPVITIEPDITLLKIGEGKYINMNEAAESINSIFTAGWIKNVKHLYTESPDAEFKDIAMALDIIPDPAVLYFLERNVDGNHTYSEYMYTSATLGDYVCIDDNITDQNYIDMINNIEVTKPKVIDCLELKYRSDYKESEEEDVAPTEASSSSVDTVTDTQLDDVTEQLPEVEDNKENNNNNQIKEDLKKEFSKSEEECTDRPEKIEIDRNEQSIRLVAADGTKLVNSHIDMDKINESSRKIESMDIPAVDLNSQRLKDTINKVVSGDSKIAASIDNYNPKIKGLE